MNPTLTINCRTIGKQTKDKPEHEQVYAAYEFVRKQASHYKAKPRRVIVQHPADTLAGERNGTADQYWPISDTHWPFTLRDIVRHVGGPGCEVFVKVEGGKPPKWIRDWYSEQKVHNFAPWQALFGLDVTVIADGLGKTSNYTYVRDQTMSLINLAPDILPTNGNGEFDSGHPAPVMFCNVQYLRRELENDRFAKSFQNHGRDITLWIRKEEDVEWALEQCERYGLTPSANGNNNVHRAVAAWLEGQA